MVAYRLFLSITVVRAFESARTYVLLVIASFIEDSARVDVRPTIRRLTNNQAVGS